MKRRGRTATNLSISIPSELLDLLRQAAFDDNRSVSGLLTSLARTYLDQEGYLRPPGMPGPLRRQTQIDFE